MLAKASISVPYTEKCSLDNSSFTRGWLSPAAEQAIRSAGPTLRPINGPSSRRICD
jgi:hypothetical protein